MTSSHTPCSRPHDESVDNLDRRPRTHSSQLTYDANEAGKDVAIVLVTYNCEHWIGKCLGSLPRALAGRTAQIVVVDNASVDRSVEVVAAHDDVRLIRNAFNVGFAAAVNQGVAATTSRWLLLLNPDSDARPASIANLLSFAETHPQFQIYGGRTLREDGSLEPTSSSGLPTVWSTTCFALGLSTLFRRTRLFDPESLGNWNRDSIREVGMITGALLLASRDLWDRLGGMDERFFMYAEDADFCFRARAIGARPVVVPTAEVFHAIGASSKTSGARTSLLMAGKVTYAKSNFSPIEARLVTGLLKIGVALRAVGHLATGRGAKWHDAWQRRREWWDGFESEHQRFTG